LGEAMPGLDIRVMDEKDMLSTRGWWSRTLRSAKEKQVPRCARN